MPSKPPPPSSSTLRQRFLPTMHRSSVEEDSSVNQPLKFSIGSDSDDDPDTKPPSQHAQRTSRRHAADNHTAPSLMHIRVARWLLRAFPRILLFLVCFLLVTALIPGGWRVGLCAMNLLPPPALRMGENITLIAHRGCEFPYPENSLHALKYGAHLLKYVELDLSLTSDGEVVVMHDHTLDRTTNGSGVVCTKSFEYIKSLVVSMPERDGRGRIAQGKHCTDKNSAGQSIPCTYRVPTLNQVFNALGPDTQYMLDVKECYTAGVTATSELCSNCSNLIQGVKKAMAANFVGTERITFTSTQTPSLEAFQKEMAEGSSYSLSLNQKYAHYKRDSFLALVGKGNFSTAAMYFGLAAMRPDLVRALRETKIPGTLKHLDAIAWTIRRDVDYRLARCAGVSKLVVAEPEKILNRLSWDVGSVLVEEP